MAAGLAGVRAADRADAELTAHALGNAMEKPTHTPEKPEDADVVTEGNFAWCFSEGCGLPVGEWLSPFDVFAWLEFGGDMEKAKAHIKAVGYGGGQVPLVPPTTGLG